MADQDVDFNGFGELGQETPQGDNSQVAVSLGMPSSSSSAPPVGQSYPRSSAISPPATTLVQGGALKNQNFDDVDFDDATSEVTQSSIILSGARDLAPGLMINGMTVDIFLSTLVRAVTPKQMVIIASTLAKLSKETISPDYVYVPPDRRVVSQTTMTFLGDGGKPSKVALALGKIPVTALAAGYLKSGAAPIEFLDGGAISGVEAQANGVPICNDVFKAKTRKEFTQSFLNNIRHGHQIWQFTNPISFENLNKIKQQVTNHSQRGATVSEIELYWAKQKQFFTVVEDFTKNQVKRFLEVKNATPAQGSALVGFAIKTMSNFNECLASCRILRGENNHYYEICNWMTIPGAFKNINTYIERVSLLVRLGGMNSSCTWNEDWKEALSAELTTGVAWVYPVDTAPIESPASPFPWAEKIGRLKKSTFGGVDVYVPNDDNDIIAIQIKVPKEPKGKVTLAAMMASENPNPWRFVPGFVPHNGYFWITNKRLDVTEHGLNKFTQYLNWVIALNCVRTLTAMLPLSLFAQRAREMLAKECPYKIEDVAIPAGSIASVKTDDFFRFIDEQGAQMAVDDKTKPRRRTEAGEAAPKDSRTE